MERNADDVPFLTNSIQNPDTRPEKRRRCGLKLTDRCKAVGGLLTAYKESTMHYPRPVCPECFAKDVSSETDDGPRLERIDGRQQRCRLRETDRCREAKGLKATKVCVCVEHKAADRCFACAECFVLHATGM